MEQAVVGVDLSPFVPRVAARWATEAPDVRTKTFDGSLVFADISGFTALSERLAKRGPIGAEELTGVLGDCFAGLLAVAYAEGGSLLKFGGDALLLLFDGPAHGLRATRAALGMRAAIRTVGRLQTSVGTVRLRMSQGVHSGDLDLYRVGGSHDELIVCGPVASEVIRMEAAADAGEIVVSPATAALLRDAAPEVVGDPKGPGVLLRARTMVHLVEGYPTAVASPEAAARSMPVAVREHLLQGGGEPEHRHVAIAFVHFDGTDGLRQRCGPGAVADALDELVRAAQDAVENEGVTFLATDIDKDGGKIILVSGAPTANEDAEGRLLRAVRRIADAGTALSVRIGVNRGHVFAGSVGPSYRRTFTVMGDAVNLAARLMAKAAPGEIVVHPSVLELSRTAFATTAIDPFLVKGKTAPVHAVLLGSIVGSQETRSTPWVAPLIGRDAELDVLRDVAVNRPQLCELTGDTGTGKTRLLHEMRSLAPDDVPVRIVSCELYEQQTAYFAMGVLVRHVLGIGRSARSDAVSTAVGRIDPNLAPFAPLIGDVVGIAVPDTPSTARLQPQYRKQRTAVVVTELLRRALASGAVVAFDDVQWMDDASLEVLRHLAAADDEPYSIVVATRSAGGELGGRRVDVNPLSAAEGRALVRAITADDPLAPHVVADVVERAAGNPLYLEELTRVARDAGGAHLPDSLEGVVTTQIDALPPRDRRQLRYAAVLGDSFEPELFADVIADESLRNADGIARRLGGLVVATHDGRVQFRHRLIRDVAYQTLPFAVRRDLHARAAQVIERYSAVDGTDRSEVLSLHCFHAQQFEKSWRYATTSASRALDKYALAEACALYERAIDAVRHVPEAKPVERFALWKSLGTCRQLLNRFPEARTAFDQARKLADDPGAVGDICLRQSELAERAGRLGAAMRWVMKGIRATEDHHDEESRKRHGMLLARGATLRLHGGRLGDALAMAEQAVTAGEAAQDDGVIALGCLVAVQATAMQGQHDDAAARRALDLFTKLGSFENVATLQMTLGTIAFWRGDWHEALELYESSRQAFEDIGALVEAAVGSGNIAEVFADQGRLDEAEAIVREVMETWRALRHTAGLALAERYLARVELRRGDAEQALARFRAARETLSRFGMTPKVVEIDVWSAECLLVLGRVEEAKALLDASVAHERSTGSKEWLAMIHRLRAYAAMSDGRLDDAWAEADDSLAIARSRESAYDVALALEVMANLAEHARPGDGRPDVELRHSMLRELGVVRPPAPPVAAAT